MREVRRILRLGAVFAGSDSRTSTVFRLAHLADTMVLVDPGTFADHLRAAGFVDTGVEAAKSSFRFRAVAPAADRAERQS